MVGAKSLDVSRAAAPGRRCGPPLAVLAFDHRSQLEALARRHHAGNERIGSFKALVAAGARRGAQMQSLGSPGQPSPGVIVDDRHGQAALAALAGTGWWVARPVEAAGSRPLEFEAGPGLVAALRAWPAEHVAKCLVIHHPDDPQPLHAAQLDQLNRLQAACAATGHEWLAEVIPPAGPPARPDTLVRAMEQFYVAGLAPDWWKLPPPASHGEWQQIAALLAQHDPNCHGVLLLGMEAGEEALAAAFRIAAQHPACQGFAVGRSIFGDAAADWFAGRCSDDEAVAEVARRYAGLIAQWRLARDADTPHTAQELAT